MKTSLHRLSVIVLIAAVVLLGPALAQSGATDSALADASEVFENLTEASATVNDAGFTKAMTAFEVLRPALWNVLSAERRDALGATVARVRDAWRRRDRGAVASQSIEAYRLLQEAIDRNGERVPVEVSLLDYAGFKTKALLLSPSPDWVQAAKTAHEASGWWSAIRLRVKDETLRAAMDHALSGLTDGVSRKDRTGLAFAAQLDLILVDGLEAFFSAGSRPGC